MFLRLLFRSMRLRRSRSLTALLAIVVAAAVSTALLSLYADLDAKLTREFRRFGANVIVTAHSGQALPADAIQRVHSVVPDASTLPEAFAVAQQEQSSMVVAGTDLAKAHTMNSWWSVTGRWPTASGEALVGKRAAQAMHMNDRFMLQYAGKTQDFVPVGTLSTGGPEDSRIYISMADLERWTGIQPTTLEVSVSGSPERVNAAVKQIASEIPDAEVRPIRQVVEAEAKVLGKTRFVLFLSTALISILVALCMLATLSASVFERRKDFAVMKALGSSQRSLNAVFVSEALLLAAVGGILGYLLGTGLAAWIGYANFHAAVTPRLQVFPAVFIASLLIALLGSSVPLLRLQKIEPAAMLRGD